MSLKASPFNGRRVPLICEATHHPTTSRLVSGVQLARGNGVLLDILVASQAEQWVFLFDLDTHAPNTVPAEGAKPDAIQRIQANGTCRFFDKPWPFENGVYVVRSQLMQNLRSTDADPDLMVSGIVNITKTPAV